MSYPPQYPESSGAFPQQNPDGSDAGYNQGYYGGGSQPEQQVGGQAGYRYQGLGYYRSADQQSLGYQQDYGYQQGHYGGPHRFGSPQAGYPDPRQRMYPYSGNGDRFTNRGLIITLSIVGPVLLIGLVTVLVWVSTTVGASTDTAGDARPTWSPESTSPRADSQSVDGGLRPGDCVNVSVPDKDGLIYFPASCDSSLSDYKVVRRMQPPVDCANQYGAITSSDGIGYCLILDVREKDCVDRGDSTEVETKVSCDDPSASIRITSVVESENPRECSSDTERYLTYPDPVRTICWKRLAGA